MSDHVSDETGTTSTPSGALVRAKAPAASTVSRALTCAGHRRSVKAPGNRAVPTPGFVVRAATGGVAYVTVFATMHGMLDRFQVALRRAGFVVEAHPVQPNALAVYAGA